MRYRAAFNVTIAIIIVISSATRSLASGSSEITSSYESIGGVKWLFSDYRDGDMDLLERAYQLGSGELPVSAQFRYAGENYIPSVVDMIRLTYPSGTPLDQRIDFMEVWITSDDASQDYALVFRGDPGNDGAQSDIEIQPYAARDIRLNLYSSYGGDGSVLPEVSLYGVEDIYQTGVYPSGEEVEERAVGFVNDMPVARMKITREAEEGGFVYRTYGDMKVEFSDEKGEAHKESISTKCNFHVNEDLLLQSCSCEDLFGGMFTVKKAKCKSRFSFNVERTIGTDEKDASYDTQEVVNEEAMLDIMAGEGLALGVKRDFQVFTWGKGDVESIVAEVVTRVADRNGEGDAWFLWIHDAKFSSYNKIVLIKEDGAIIRMFDFSSGLEFSFEEEWEEWEIGVLELDLAKRYREILKKSRDFIRIPGKVAAANIFIRWNELRPETLTLESERQRVVSLEEVEPGIFEAELETMARYPEKQGFQEPEYLSDVELETYLLPDRVVRSDMKEFIKLADEIAGDETDPIVVSELIFNWLIDNMFPDLVNTFDVEPANIIRKKMRGDCKHYATMFATLARARGIPTRFAIGQRYLGGEYGYHVWNQVYVDGYWIDMDASSTFLYPGALHIQMDVTPSFNAKSNLGVLLGLRPEPEILDWQSFEPEYYVLDNSVDTEITDTYYQDAYFRFKMAIPGGFKPDIMDLGFMRKINLEYSKDERLKAVVYVLPNKIEDPDIKDILSMVGSEAIQFLDLFGQIKNFKGKKRGETKISGRKAFFYLGSFMGDNGQYIKMDITFLPIEDRLFVFMFYGPSNIYDDQSKNLGSIKESIQIMD